jgi:hypothetical protein
MQNTERYGTHDINAQYVPCCSRGKMCMYVIHRGMIFIILIQNLFHVALLPIFEVIIYYRVSDDKCVAACCCL